MVTVAVAGILANVAIHRISSWMMRRSTAPRKLIIEKVSASSGSFGQLEAIAAVKGFEVWSNWFSNRAEIESSLQAGGHGDIVFIIGHGAQNEEGTETLGMGTNEFFFGSSPILASELSSLASRDGDPPSIVGFAGCQSADLNSAFISGGVSIASGYTRDVSGYELNAPMAAFLEQLIRGESIDDAEAAAPGDFLSVEVLGGVNSNKNIYDNQL
jgi:hypothetical protein